MPLPDSLHGRRNPLLRLAIIDIIRESRDLCKQPGVSTAEDFCTKVYSAIHYSTAQHSKEYMNNTSRAMPGVGMF